MQIFFNVGGIILCPLLSHLQSLIIWYKSELTRLDLSTKLIQIELSNCEWPFFQLLCRPRLVTITVIIP